MVVRGVETPVPSRGTVECMALVVHCPAPRGRAAGCMGVARGAGGEAGRCLPLEVLLVLLELLLVLHAAPGLMLAVVQAHLSQP